MIVIPTVQHTGTRFLVSLFPAGAAKGWHVTDQEMPVIRELLKHDIGVVPMRDPALTYASWARREGTEHRKTGIDKQFDNLMEIDQLFDLHYFHIDAEDREAELAKLNLILPEGLKIHQTDWQPIGATAPTNAPVAPVVPGKVIDFYIRIRK